LGGRGGKLLAGAWEGKRCQLLNLEKFFSPDERKILVVPIWLARAATNKREAKEKNCVSYINNGKGGEVGEGKSWCYLERTGEEALTASPSGEGKNLLPP